MLLLTIILHLILLRGVAPLTCTTGIYEVWADSDEYFLFDAECEGVCGSVMSILSFLQQGIFSFCASPALVAASGRDVRSKCDPSYDLCFCNKDQGNNYFYYSHYTASTQETAISCFQGVSLGANQIFSGGHADCYGTCMRVRMGGKALYTCAPPGFCATANVTTDHCQNLHYSDVCCCDQPNCFDPLPSVCPDGWSKSSMYPKCYLANQTTANFNDAAAACQRAHSYSELATVANAFENSEIAAIAEQTWPSGTPFRVGLTREHLNGNWTWQDGSSPNYTNWAYGSENWAGNSVVVDPTSLKWWTRSDFDELPFVCETKLMQ